MKRALALGAVTGLMAFGIAPAAHAGEITGGKTPKPTPISPDYTGKNKPSNSECAFSGLDDLTEIGAPSPDARPRTPQSYGQIIKVIGSVNGAFTPANSGCNKNVPPPPMPS